MKELSECRVLIVDDVTANVDLLVEGLRADYRISAATDGESALRIVQRSPPDLVLLDIVMPGIDGYEVCRRLRAAEATREIPIMFLSSLEDATDKARGFELGANDYLTKPFEMLEVKARVRSLLKARAYAEAVREAREKDLRIAREIQMGLLPADVPARVQGTGLDAHGLLEPAQHVGGDLYEILRLADDRVMVALGDVSGKGIPAALFMAVTMTLLRSMARQFAEPDEILRRVNDELLEQNPRGMFVTLQCLIFDLARRRLSCANGGHHEAVLVTADGKARPVLPSSGRVVGLLPDNPVTTETLDLAAGDTFVLFTDGVSEAFSADEELFGESRLMSALSGRPSRTARETSLGLLEAVRRHATDAKQSDDITIVSVRYAPRA